MENAIVVPQQDQIELIRQAQMGLANADDIAFGEIAKGADYLCRLQLQGSNSNLVKLKKIPSGNYAYIVSKDNFQKLGESVDVLPIMWRPRAIDMSSETPVSCFDPKSEIFKSISERSFGQDSSCTFGPDFLVWIPEIKKFASLHWGSKTARVDAPAFKKILDEQKAATLTVRSITKGKNIWDAMTVNVCSTPFEYPDGEQLKLEIGKFIAEANKKAPEKADAKTTGRTR